MPGIRIRSKWRFAVSVTGLALALTVPASRSPAGDILRGGAPMGVRPSGGDTAANVQASEAAAAARANAQDRLARTTQALQAVRNMQAAARSAAAASSAANLGLDPNHPGQQLPNVPNGLGVGGLQVAPGVPKDLANPVAGEDPSLWRGADLPVQTVKGKNVEVNIRQTEQQAVLNWITFNVGKDTSVHFDQSAGGSDVSKWIAFNKINDPSGVPSQILGSISAEGQVYLINQNGIIFGGASQINLHTLVASSLPINDNLISRGLLSNPDAQFLFTALAQPAGDNTPAFTPDPPPNGRIGDVRVESGATLTSPTSVDGVGGRVMLVGGNVSNEGTISTPDGQTILAAGLQLGIDGHSTDDPSIRGLDVFVGSVSSASLGTGYGSVTNAGLIEIPRGNVTMSGSALHQSGVIDSSTTVAVNGTVVFDASYNAIANNGYDPTRSTSGRPFLFRNTGTITLDGGGAIQILPELLDPETVVGTQLALRSGVQMRGLNIYAGTGSTLLAPNADVSLQAGQWSYVSSATAPISTFIRSAGQIYLDENALISVAGTVGVQVPLTQNILAIELRGSELANSPLQRNGVLRAQTITLDIRNTGVYNGLSWVGTPLGDASGFANLIKRGVGQLTTEGGDIALEAGGSVVMQAGSRLDVGGGSVEFLGAMVQTSRVLSGGYLMDIAKATPDLVYDGVYTGEYMEISARWGVSSTFAHPLSLMGAHFESTYIQGANAGSISIKAPSMVLDGELAGRTIPGERQVRDTASSSALPTPASLALRFEAQENLPFQSYPIYSPTPPTVIFEEPRGAVTVGSFDIAGVVAAPLPTERVATVQLSPKLFDDDGFGEATVANVDGDIIVPPGVTLIGPPNGKIDLFAANIRINGDIRIPGGTVNLTAYNISPAAAAALRFQANPATPPPNADRGTVQVGGAIDTAGLLTNDRPSSPTGLIDPIVPNGGIIRIDSFNAYLDTGSLLNVSGGAFVSATGSVRYGNAGTISILTGQDQNIDSVLDGELALKGTLRGLSGATGGTLELMARLVKIGGTHTSAGLWLPPEFFNRGGFQSFIVRGIGAPTENTDVFLPGLTIAAGTHIAPIVTGLLAMPLELTGEKMALNEFQREFGIRPAANLTFAAIGVKDAFNGNLLVRGALELGASASIVTEPAGSISLQGDTVAVFGRVSAPAGSISVAGASSYPQLSPGTSALPTVFLAPGSKLSARGAFVPMPDDRFGRKTGRVLPGGTISASGNIVAAAGSLLDVSGASAFLEYHPAYLNLNAPGGGTIAASPVSVQSGVNMPLYQSLRTMVRVDSNAGSIALKGAQELFVDATLLGRAGGPTALGGSLSVSSGRFVSGLDDTARINLVVQQSGPTIPAMGSAPGIGRAVRDATGAIIPGMGYFAADSFLAGGFDSLALGGNVSFNGPVEIDARSALRVATGGVIRADAPVSLTATYVALGQPFRPPLNPLEQFFPFLQELATGGADVYHFLPTFGQGSLTVQADLIDVGILSLQNIGEAKLAAPRGSIRGNGSLDIAGNLTLEAGQIYPVTASSFSITAYDYSAGGVAHTGSVTVRGGSDTGDLPLSAGGSLSIYASTIHQGGAVVAPLGSISLGWDGTGTAPQGFVTGQSVPVTASLVLDEGSVTSVSASGLSSGSDLFIPYGLSPDGDTWIDPRGVDITGGGVPLKKITLAGKVINVSAGALVDLQGGGDLFAYQWIKGNGGTQDVLASSNAFAVIPGYEPFFSPYNAFNTSSVAGSLNGDPGYTNSSLQPGSRIYLQGSTALAEGVYTLLPARYAVLPGAILVTPKSGQPVGSVLQNDESSLVGGYRFSSLNSERNMPVVLSQFEVAPGTVYRQRAAYASFLGNVLLAEGASALDQPLPRLPRDAGQLVFQATQSLSLQGSVKAGAKGRGGLVDIGSPSDILIAGPQSSASAGALVLDASELSQFGVESFLIGGTRNVSGGVDTVTVNTGNLTVSNAGFPLEAPDVILVAKTNLVFSPGAAVSGPGTGLILAGADSVVVNGNGLLARVSTDENAAVTRTGVTSSTIPGLVVGAGTTLSGASVILDSSYGMSLDPAALLTAGAITLNSGQISLGLLDSGAINPTAGLILEGAVLDNLAAANRFSLLSYTSLDVYGNGTFGSAALGQLAIDAGQIRGFNTGAGAVSFFAASITLGNRASAPSAGTPAVATGSLVFDARTITLGSGNLAIDQFVNATLNGAGGILAGASGSLAVAGNLTIQAPVLTAAAGTPYSVASTGAFVASKTGSGSSQVAGGLGGTLSLLGASVALDSDVLLPSGLLSVRATSGELTVGGALDVGGTAQDFYDVTRYTDAGQILLSADLGNVTLDAGSLINMGAVNGGGSAGTLSVTTAGSLTLNGVLSATGESGGSFVLDVGTLPSTSALNAVLDAASFSNSRIIRVRNGDVLIDGLATSSQFKLFADGATNGGNITVNGTLDASGVTGGEIGLFASGGVLVDAGAVLDVSAQHFDSAGKGGSVTIEAGSSVQGLIDQNASVTLADASTIDLRVTDYVAGSQTTPESSAFLGEFTGTLDLRAPLIAAGTNVAVNPFAGEILGASRIGVEGYKVYDLTASGGAISTTVRNQIRTDGNTFGASFGAITNTLLAATPGLQSVLVLRPGAEIINRAGDLTLSSDWDLSSYRFGTAKTPGVLTLRAWGDLNFQGALSDGFDPARAPTGTANLKLWLAPLLVQNVNLPANTQSYDYQLTAGADLSSANPGAVLPVGSLAAGKGNFLLGKNASAAQVSGGRDATTAGLIGNFFQVIRTGSGDIDIAAGRDVQLLNPFASIYTAGTVVQNPTSLFATGDFVLPVVSSFVEPPAPNLGAAGQGYFAQYSLAGGNVTINAGQDITRLTRDQFNNLIADSSRQMPTNWLYRRGYVDPLTGTFGSAGTGTEPFEDVVDLAASTSWWVDFSNFFQDVGTLGGGDVSLIAGRDVANVGAVAATNARMPRGVPDASKLVELGGGDVTVKAGRNIDAGVYYVQRGHGTLSAGGSITTNKTRSPSLGILQSFNNPTIYDSRSWLPTTLFFGDAQFDVNASGNVLLGAMANPFILPQGLKNRYWYKTYFFDADTNSSVNISSLGGDLTLREAVELPGETSVRPVLDVWYQSQLLLDFLPNSAAWYQPWLRLAENGVNPFQVLDTTAVPTLRATVFSGDINTVGTLNLLPSPTGQLELLARGSINGLNPAGISQFIVRGRNTVAWASSTINLSDSSPSALPGITSPFAYRSVVGLNPNLASVTNPQFLDALASFFQETDATDEVLQVKQTLHARGPLHLNDTNPVRLYAGTGSISDLTLYTPKETRLIAGGDITDIGLYLQNLKTADFALVSAGRDILAYNANSPARVAAQTSGNALAFNASAAQSGDIQINGPGALEVFAGRNVDLGTGSANADGTGTGITSVGNLRNPYLPAEGANIIGGAGMDLPLGLAGGEIDFVSFLTSTLQGPNSARYLAELTTMDDSDQSGGSIPTDFASLSPQEQAELGLKVFFLVLRDSGRDFNDPLSPDFGTYAAGQAAIALLFPDAGIGGDGDLNARGRDIRTRNGGDISLLIPGGSVTLANTVIGNPLAPPGIITEAGGGISIFAGTGVDIGIGRIFTLRGGSEIIWSSTGDIAAGSSAKTVQSAPPTRVLIDPQSADVITDLAGLATGGGIGVLATLASVVPGDVDLIAPAGIIDAGDAGIRSSGNLTLAAVQVLNATNIQAAGSTSGAPPPPVVAAPNIGGLTAASNAAGAATNSAANVAQQAAQETQTAPRQTDLPSIIIVEVLGYGGGA